MKSKINANIHYLVFSLFIFNSINREFLIFGELDVRFILMIIVSINITTDLKFVLYKLKKTLNSIVNGGFLRKIAFFYLVMVISTLLSLIFNKELVETSLALRLSILNFYCMVILLYYLIYKDYLSKSKIYYIITVSLYVLLFSMTVAYLNNTEVTLSSIWSPVKGMVTGPRLKNFFGKNFRIAGYAEDANYASFVLLLYPLVLLKINENKWLTVFTSISAFLGLMFAASLTVVFAFITSLLIVFVDYLVNKKYGLKFAIPFRYAITVMILISPIAILMLGKFLGLNYTSTFGSSLGQRFIMWESALELFTNSPLIGSGLGSARTFFDIGGARSVQMHNTTFQLISEFGILGFLTLTSLLASRAASTKGFSLFTIVYFSVFSLTQELTALSFFPLVLIISFSFNKSYQEPFNVVFINSLSGGGAEKAVLTRLKGQKKKAILLCDSEDLDLDGILLLSTNGIIKKGYAVFLLPYCINIFGEENLVEISSHLFKSHILSWLSSTRRKTVYCFHSTASSFKDNGVFRIAYKIIYRQRKLAFLYDEIGSDFISEFSVVPKKVYTFSNPIDFDLLDEFKYLEEKTVQDKPYLLFCGRLEYVKDLDFLIKMYHQTKLIEDYDLAIVGSGTMLDLLKKKVADLNLEKKVHFVGYLPNPYMYIKNATLTLLTSHYEADPTILYESLYMGVKVLAYDCNFGPRNILRGNLEKMLIHTKDIETWANRIQELTLIQDFEIEDALFDRGKLENIIIKIEGIYSDKVV